MQTRRAFLTSVPLAASSALLSGCAQWSFFQSDLTPGAIDIHAHVFNGRDIPVLGFLTTTYIRDPHVPVDPDMTSDPFLRLMRSILLAGTPTARQELDQINAGGIVVEAAQARSADDLLAQDSRNVETGIRDFLDEVSDGAGLVDSETLALTDRLFEETGLTFGDDLVDPAEIPGRVARRIFERTQSGQETQFARVSPFMQTLRWAGLLTRARADILGELVRLYGGENRIRVFSPSLVDFGRWYPRQEPVSLLRDQVAVMSALAKRRRDAVILNFAPYCPLRAALAREDEPDRDPLALVKDAVRNKGFAGVKLYPPVGFRPLGNADIRFAGVARAPVGGGRALDRELRELYAWCTDNGVPIKAHANNSIGRGQCTALYASPENWRPVLERHTDLRLNLAHFGGFDDTDPLDNECDPESPRLWEELTADLVEEFPSIYFDVGFWTDVVRETEGRRTRLQATRALFERVPEMSNRIMYGSDWSMIGRIVGHEAYLGEIQRAALAIGFDDSELARFESENARRYLGLAPGDPQHDRLSRFFGPDHLFTELFGA